MSNFAIAFEKKYFVFKKRASLMQNHIYVLMSYNGPDCIKLLRFWEKNVFKKRASLMQNHIYVQKSHNCSNFALS
jgi:chlorite dismutase